MALTALSRELQRCHGELAFLWQAQRLAASGENMCLAIVLENRFDEFRGGFQDMLAIVENDQYAAFVKYVSNFRKASAATGRLDAKHLAEQVDDGLGISCGRQRHQVDAIGKST